MVGSFSIKIDNAAKKAKPTKIRAKRISYLTATAPKIAVNIVKRPPVTIRSNKPAMLKVDNISESDKLSPAPPAWTATAKPRIYTRNVFFKETHICIFVTARYQ